MSYRTITARDLNSTATNMAGAAARRTRTKNPRPDNERGFFILARATGLEPATTGSTAETGPGLRWREMSYDVFIRGILKKSYSIL